MAGDSVALILEYLRAHHYIKAEAALQEEVGLLQQGEEEEEEEDSPPTLLSSILNLASMASAVDRIDPVGETQASPKQDLSMEEEKSIETPHRRCIASLLVGESRCSDKKVESGDDTVEPRKSLENCGNGKTSGTLGMAHALEFDVEELPQLPPAKLYTPEKSSKDLSMEQEEKIIASPHRRRIASLLVGESRCSDKKVESGDETVNPRKSSENCGNGKMSGTLGMAHALEFNAEELPRPPPAKLDTPEKSSEEQEEKSISSPHTRHTVSPPVEENMHSDKKVESGDETVNPRKSSENCSNGKMSGTSGMAHVLEFDMEELPQLPPAKLYTPKKSAEDLSIEQEEKSIASPHRRHTASPLVEGNMHSDKKVESGDETVNPRKSSDTQEENCGGGISSTLGLTRALEFDAEELPWLPPVKLYTPEKSAEDLPMEEEEEKSIASPRRGHTPPPPLEESMNSDKTVQSGDKTVDPRKSLDIQEENCSDGTMSSSTLGLARVLEFDAEELPRLPPVKLYTSEKNAENNTKDGSGAGNSSRSFESAVSQSLGRTPSEEGDCDGATFFDVPFSQETSTSGVKQLLVRPSVSQGIIEDGSDHLSSFVTASDDESESVEDHFDEYWDSDTYEDDDDPGYIRQPIEDEFWFLANNIDYPTEDERSRNLVENSYSFLKELDKLEENASQQESVLSVEEYYRSKASNGDWLTDEHLYTRHSDQDGVSLRVDQENNLVDHLREKECFDLLGVEASQGGFKDESSRDEDNGEKKIEADNFHYGCVKSGSIASNSDPSEMETHVREIVLCSSNEGKTERVQNQEVTSLRSSQTSNPNEGGTERDQDQEVTSLRYGQTGNPNEGDTEGVDDEEGTSFRSSQTSNPNDLLAETDGKCARTQAVSVGHYMNKKATEDMADGYNNEVNQQRWYARDCKAFDIVNPCEVMKNLEMAEMQARTKSVERDGFLFHPSIAGFTARDEDADEYDNEKYKLNDSSAMCKENSSESSPMASPKNDCVRNRSPLTHSDSSVHSIEVYMKTQEVDSTLDGQDVAKIQEGVEAIAAENDDDTAIEHELIQRLEMEKDEYEVFNLKIVHRKNRTGFEEDKDFPVVINSIVAGRYCVTGYLGSAAFSKAIQAHDLYSGTDVCMKIIKNNKDYFDQSLDEIKLLKYINRHDPDDKHHILRLYDYFYHREHLFIVCELLRANLYEFQKFNKESGGEVYFTMPCLQAITRQCLEALEFIHGLGLIHCDLKPENILVKSYSRCQIKVIDFGSSCFQTDHLCSYVQSRSYRAPEVILGLPYDSTIDIWSLGCILAELCSGNVLFQNDSIATLLARVVGILGPIDPDMLAEGRDTYKYFTKNHLLYERNQENGQLEYLIPKKTSLTHRLKMGDKGFVEFVQYLLHINPMERPTASEALKHKWLLHSYEQVPS